jgi:hypothetical protein
MANKLEHRLWISYDLGLTGEYEQLYAWLDKHGAKECGPNVATFLSDKSRDEIVGELRGLLDIKRNPRVYVITMKAGGKFVLGRRKVAAWTGYAQVLESGEERDA